MPTIDIKQECPDCKGTGLYRGMGERKGAAVVCYACEGTGCYHFRHEYQEFKERKIALGVSRVYRSNPGICIGKGNGKTLEDFGGMPWEDWEAGYPFPPRSEDRAHTCPAWWYQSADCAKKPKWEECALCGAFSDCSRFPDRAACWAKWDRENPEG